MNSFKSKKMLFILIVLFAITNNFLLPSYSLCKCETKLPPRSAFSILAAKVPGPLHKKLLHYLYQSLREMIEIFNSLKRY